jgi:Tol biopolymer transport system component
VGVLADPAVVSLSTGGDQGSSASRGAAVSADGRYVAFTSTAPLAGPSTGGALQLYVRDRQAGRTLLASATANGQPANAPVDDPADHRAYAISGDGRFVVFASTATNLAPDESDGAARDVFRKDLATGVVAVVSRSIEGAAANGPVDGDPDLSYDGSRVVYETGSATNLWSGDASPASEILMRDLVAGTVEPVTVASSGAALTGPLRRPAISADGGTVAFEADTTVAIRDIDAKATVVVSDAADPDISGDGGVVVYESAGGVFRRSLPVGSPAGVFSSAHSPSVSADGARVVVESPVYNPPVADVNGVADVYARRFQGTPERVSERADGSEVAAPSTRPAISGNGAVVAYDLDDGATGQSLAAGDGNDLPDVLTASLAGADMLGPVLAVTAPAENATAGGSVTVAGTASDPSGVVSVIVGGWPARRAGGGAFAVDVPLVPGPNPVTVRALDGAGNVTERVVSVVRPPDSELAPVAKARARSLTVRRVGRTTIARFRLDQGATRAAVRLWRRVPRAGRPPSWTAVGAPRRIPVNAGERRVIVHTGRLRPDVYQVRVAVVSRGGVAVTSARHVVQRTARPR